ncbi:uncharacterized protein A1O9_10697 [Exophiala aquamarina CBS 119918]|uniref:Transcription factor domain-containing protein n=1 Tax=Exophiala aquamarina CBS 119918 TaxID=1182545 RepID=A0A072NZE3_9EURO|nr:uncharacterized protein A1O9_10697 [Exophiala aquamarina CBS 119918]KEF53249.1 hypothetical protein A1O9_10697 [Exophiala aquamarina CBS 119918]
MPLFPFVHILPSATPSSLLQERPILYLAILVVASQNNVERQLKLVKVIREEVSRRFMISSQQDLGVLEGLLVYLAWNHVHLALGTPSVRVIHMIMALVTELGLDKEPNTISNTSPGGVSAIEFDALKFGKYADNCCRILEETMEYPTDIYLVQIVRIQRIADESRTTLYNEALESASEFSTLLSMGMASLERDLREVGTTLRLDIPQAGETDAPLPNTLSSRQDGVVNGNSESCLTLSSVDGSILPYGTGTSL